VTRFQKPHNVHSSPAAQNETLQFKLIPNPERPKFPKSIPVYALENSWITAVEAAVCLLVASSSRTAVTINPFIVRASNETGSAAFHCAVGGTVASVIGGGQGIDGASHGHEAEEEYVEFGHLGYVVVVTAVMDIEGRSSIDLD